MKGANTEIGLGIVYLLLITIARLIVAAINTNPSAFDAGTLARPMITPTPISIGDSAPANN